MTISSIAAALALTTLPLWPGMGVAANADPAAPKIMTVVLENTNYAAALRQPFLASLAKRGALLTHFTAIAHPSQPNYIALVAGSTYGVDSDANVTLDKPHVGDLVEAKGLQWKAYAEAYPGNCFLGAHARTYVRKHVPFLSFKNVQDNPERCARVVNASQLTSDVGDGKLPDYSLYIPDRNNDGHDTGVAYADRWLADTFGPRLQDQRFTHDLLFIVTFDEGKGDFFGNLFGGNRVATIILGDSVRPGTVLAGDYNHYSLLRLAEDRLELGNLGQGDARAAAITGLGK